MDKQIYENIGFNESYESFIVDKISPTYNCKLCNKLKTARRSEVLSKLRGDKGRGSYEYCSLECFRKYYRENVYYLFNINVECRNCGAKFSKTKAEINKSPNNFCTKSCAVTFNNKNKARGIRRSKLEKLIEEKLLEVYDFEIHFGRKDAIGSELDIYIPSLKTAFEINGIFHREPIFGQEKLGQIQANDRQKELKCFELGIELVVLDDTMKHFNEQSALRYFNVICSILNRKG